MVVVVLAMVVVVLAVVVMVAVVVMERVSERGVVQVEGKLKYFTLPVATLETNRRLC